MSYVDPQNIFDPKAPPLTEEETDVQMLDSFRTGRQFIKAVADPVTENAVSKLVKTLPLCKDCRGLFKDASVLERPPCAVCFHLFKKPTILTDEKGEQHHHFGWVKLRGEFPTNGTAENEIRGLMQDHDTYTKTELMPKGVFWPLTTMTFKSQEAIDKMYDKDVKNQADIQKAMIEMERKKEEALEKMKEDTEPGSLEDYIKQKVRLCTAEVKLKKARELIAHFEPILETVTKEVALLEAENKNYPEDGLKLYQDKMTEIGYPVPLSFYDNITPGV
jgi:hypothetical protein